MDRQKLLIGMMMFAWLVLAGCTEKKTEVSNQPAPEAAPKGLAVNPATAGTLTGKVSFEGNKPRLARIMMDQDPVCVKKHGGKPVYAEDGEVNSNGTLPDVFVYVKEGADQYSFPTPSEAVTLDQDGCVYKPHVLGIMVDQQLKVVTSDPTTHNIHPMPKDNREWNESQPPGAAPIEKSFARPEVMIPVKCNQHPWMRAYIGVVKTPLYAVTGSDGAFTIKGLPPGDYTVEAWTAIGGREGQTQDQKVTVGSKETKTVDFTFKAT